MWISDPWNKFPIGTPKKCQRMVVDGGKEQQKAVVFFTTVPFLAGMVLNMNLQNGFKDGTTASDEVQEADTAWMCLNVFVARGIAGWPVVGGTPAWFTCRVGGHDRFLMQRSVAP